MSLDTLNAQPVMKRVFFNSLGNCRYSFKSGKEAIFLNGEYLTDSPIEIYELKEEILAGHPHIYINPDKVEIDTVFRDPMDVIRAQVRLELLKEQAAIKNADQDFGKSDQNQKIVVGNTTTAAEAMSGSTSFDAPVGAGSASIIASATTASNTARVITPGPKA